MIPRYASRLRASLITSAVFLSLASLAPTASAGEGGTSHILPGATATLVDLPPTANGWFFKPMYLNYNGEVSAQMPTAIGITGSLDVNANTVVVGGGYTFDQKILGGGSYTVAMFAPHTSLDVTATIQTPFGTKKIHNEVSGMGDMTLVPVMLAWKSGNWQYDVMMPVYAPTGSYELGRLGNPGLNYWTFDPVVGTTYSNKSTGFNASAHLGYAMNTENNDTDYQSGSLTHFEGAIQQVVPVGTGFMTLGAEGFYFDQTTADSGKGATLGDFKGRTAGAGPVVGYILPLNSKESLVFELKWLKETETRKRLEGDYTWLKMVYKF
jgi:hypothetical protein